jgi:hypothetical protein
MKVAISLSDKIFREAEAAAKTRGISRSQLYATALAAFLQQHRPSGVTAKLNAIYGKKPATMDRVLNQMQLRSLPEEDW